MSELKAGDVVTVKNHNGIVLYTANVHSISKTGVCVNVTHPKTGYKMAFYRQNYAPRLFVNSPGSGLCGSMLNDRFTI